VTVTALINESGQVTKVEVDKSDDPLLTEAAIQAMKRARFTPAMQGKKPIKVWYTQTIIFKLNGVRSVDELPRLHAPTKAADVPVPTRPTKSAVLIGKAPALPINIAGATTMELEITVGMYGDVLNVQPVDAAHKAAFTAEAEKIVRALKFLPGEIDNQARMTRTRITFKLK
jgi:TonB family protein